MKKLAKLVIGIICLFIVGCSDAIDFDQVPNALQTTNPLSQTIQESAGSGSVYEIEVDTQSPGIEIVNEGDNTVFTTVDADIDDLGIGEVIPEPAGPPGLVDIPPPIEDDFFPPDDFFFFNDAPFVGVCGNGVREGQEQCDDGNLDNNDGCNILCRLPACANGVVEGTETCDDGNLLNNDGCSAICQIEVCGNGILDVGEECDDNNLDNGDGCSKICMLEKCGNDMIDPGEQCDDGNFDDGDGCSRFCEVEICGNGDTTPNEQCDDGNTQDGDGCSSECLLEQH